MDKAAYSITEARIQLGGISNGKFYDLVNAGYLRLTKVGSRSIVRRDALEDCLDKLDAQTKTHAA